MDADDPPAPVIHAEAVRSAQPVLPLPPVVLPPPPVPLQNAYQQRPSSSNRGQCLTICLIVLVSVVLAIQIGPFILHRLGRAAGMIPVRPPMMHALAEIVPVAPCIPLTGDQIRQGVFVLGSSQIVLRDIRESLLFHMQDRNLSAVCAQFMQSQRICYCIVNMIRSPESSQNLVHMFNMKPIGYSRNSYTRNEEQLPFCKASYVVRRFAGVTVEYLDEEGVLQERIASGWGAQFIQQMDDVQRGEGYCVDSNLEALVYAVRKRIDQLGVTSPSPQEVPAIRDK